MARPEFWFSIGSTYSYLTVSRLPEIEAETGIRFDWRPFSVREIMVEMDNVPFAKKPVKAAYMWRDIARRAEARDLSPILPAPYPLKAFDLANRIAILARHEGWCRDYATATYRRWFEHGEEAGGTENVAAVMAGLGRDAAEVIARAEAREIESAYRDATREARERGIFGSPSFVVGGELFWGDDRLEDALSWLRDGRVTAR